MRADMKKRKNHVWMMLAAGLALVARMAPGQATPAALEPAKPAAPKTFAFKNGDRVALIGNTVLERDQTYGYLESTLALALGDTSVTVRNLAWSGDTVFGHARSYFGPPSEGLERLSSHIEMIKPTVAVLCYGSEMAFERLGGLPDFLTAYRQLLDRIRSKSPGVRFVIVAPPPLETLPPPLPDQTDANRNLSSLRDALRKFALMQNAFFVDWFELMGGVPAPGRAARPLTENGVHYTEEGYQKLAATLVQGLGLKVPQVAEAEMAPLRKAVREKDVLFFRRWRPTNETYLFGFRKHEQGQNAAEIPMFDPLIEAADKHVQEVKAGLLASRSRP